MGLLRPDLPDFDMDDWAGRPEGERVAMMCRSWTTQGFGAPLGAYLFYVAKIALFVWLWVVFASRTPGIDGFSNIGDWWDRAIAFEKAMVWTLLFEVLGLGCGSGPLTGRYLPPIAAPTHWLRPGTTRLPAFPRLVPFTVGHRRTLVDVILYVALVAAALRALLSTGTTLDAAHLWPIVVILPVLGLRDKTIFLAARAEHYWATCIVFLVAGDDLKVLVAGSMVVLLVIWWGAATSKLNHHFPSVITIMVSNAPFFPAQVKRAMYRDHPRDLRPSNIPTTLAHVGTGIEYLFPLVLALSSGGRPTAVALVVMTGFHLFITSCVPMGVPIEWNIVVVYSMFVLFGTNASVSPLDVLGSPLLAALLALGVVAGPIYGNLRPDRVSFLPGMRYYAGNWAASVWLFRRGQEDALDRHITKTARTVARQLTTLYDEQTVGAVLGKLRAFRSMHLHGRALNTLLPFAVDDLADYDAIEGEGIAGVVLGWNFGDGHLHHEQLLAAVQDQCRFAPGDLRAVFLESQPMGRADMHWRIVDAADGLIDQGHIAVADLLAHQPWPVISDDTPAIATHAG